MLVIKKDRSSSCELNEKLEVLKNFSNINTYPIEVKIKNFSKFEFNIFTILFNNILKDLL
jgi:hypothetical protein